MLSFFKNHKSIFAEKTGEVMGNVLRLHLLNRYLLYGQIECSAGDGQFINGENLFQCSNCKTYCYLDCWLAYESKCPHCLFPTEVEKFSVDLEITEDDKFWALLAYIFSPFIPPMIMIMDNKKDRPFIIVHVFQAFIIGLIGIVMWFFCFRFLVWFYQIYLGLQAYQGRYAQIPLITDFFKELGWA